MELKSLDNLILFLLDEIALSRNQGLLVFEIFGLVNQFYCSHQTQQVTLNDTPKQSPTLQNVTVDDAFQTQVLRWLTDHQDICLSEHRNGSTSRLSATEFHHQLDLPALEELSDEAAREHCSDDTPNIHRERQNVAQQQQQGTPDSGSLLKIDVSEERKWRTICGHPKDNTKVSDSEFALLCMIASYRHGGILQGDLAKQTGQDKRSVPKRTDALCDRGYIDKRATHTRGLKTSRLVLRKFLPNVANVLNRHLETGSDSLIESQADSIDFPSLVEELFSILQRRLIITRDDLKAELNMSTRWRSRVLMRMLRKFESIGCLKRVKAASELSKNFRYRFDCVKLLRQPTDHDLQIFSSANTTLVTTLPAVEYEAEDEGEDDLGNSTVAAPSGENKLEEMGRSTPLWNPDRHLSNMLQQIVESARVEGLTNKDLRQIVFGNFLRRPMENLLAKLTSLWFYAQPPFLRHLSIIRDVVLSGTVPLYIHCSFTNFQERVDSGQAFWEAVRPPEADATNKFNSRPPVERGSSPSSVELDKFGFPADYQPCHQLNNAQATSRQALLAQKPKDLSHSDKHPFQTSRGRVSALIEQGGGRPLQHAKSTRDQGPMTNSDLVTFNPKGQSMQEKIAVNSLKPQLGRPRKFMRGTEKFWQQQFSMIKEMASSKQSKNIKFGKGTMTDSAGLSLFAQRPPDFDSTLVAAIESGLPVPPRPQDITQGWVDETLKVLGRSAAGLYISPVGARGSTSAKPRGVSRILILRSWRICKRLPATRTTPSAVRWLASSAAHTFPLFSVCSEAVVGGEEPMRRYLAAEPSETVSAPVIPAQVVGLVAELNPSGTSHQDTAASSLSLPRYVRKKRDEIRQEPGSPQAQLSPSEKAAKKRPSSTNEATKLSLSASPAVDSARETRSRTRLLSSRAAPEDSARHSTALPELSSIGTSKAAPAPEPPRSGVPSLAHDPGAVVAVATNVEMSSQEPIVEAERGTDFRSGLHHESSANSKSRECVSIGGASEPERDGLQHDDNSGNTGSNETEADKDSALRCESVSQPLGSAENAISPEGIVQQSVDLETARTGSVNFLRRKIMLNLVEKCDGVIPHYPNSKVLSTAFCLEWQKAGQKGTPDPRTVRAIIKSLCQNGSLKQITFSHRSAAGVMVTKFILAKTELTSSHPKIVETQEKMIDIDPGFYYPASMKSRSEPSAEVERSVRAGWPKIVDDAIVETSSTPALVLKQQLRKTLSEARERRTLCQTSAERARNDRIKRVAGEGPFRLPSLKRARLGRSTFSSRSRLSQQCRRSSSDLMSSHDNLDTRHQSSSALPALGLSRPTSRPATQAHERNKVDKDENYAQDTRTVNDHNVRGDTAGERLRPSTFKSHRQRPRTMSIAWGDSDQRLRLPSSLEDILRVVAGKKTWNGSRKNDQIEFDCIVDRIASWEQKCSTSEGNHLASWHFINLSPGKAFRSAPLDDGTVYAATFEGLVWFDSRGSQHIERRLYTDCINANLESHERSEPSVPRRSKEPAGASYKKLIDGERPTRKRTSSAIDEAEPRKRQRRGRVPPTQPQLIKDSAGNVVDVSHLIGAKYRRPRGTQHLRTLPEHLVYKLTVTIVVVRALAGGLEKHIDWKLVMSMFPQEDEKFLRDRWKTLSNKHRRDVGRLMESFQASFPEAYANNEVPYVNFDEPQDVDWEAIIQWAMQRLERPVMEDVEELPATRQEFDQAVQMKKEALPRNYRDLLGYNQAVTVPMKEEAIMGIPFCMSLPAHPARRIAPAVEPKNHAASDDDNSASTLAQSWALATIATPIEEFDAAKAHGKLQSIASNAVESDAMIETAIRALISKRAVCKKRDKGIDAKGRSYDLSRVFIDMLDQRRTIHAEMLRQAVRHKVEVLDPVFLQGGVVEFRPVSVEDGDMIAILNLAAHGRIKIRPGSDLPQALEGSRKDHDEARATSSEGSDEEDEEEDNDDDDNNSNDDAGDDCDDDDKNDSSSSSGSSNGAQGKTRKMKKRKEFGYQTRKISREALYFTVFIEHDPAAYIFGSHPPLPPSLRQSGRKDASEILQNAEPTAVRTPNYKNEYKHPIPILGTAERDYIPVWRNIHGNLQPQMWESALAAVLGIVATRPGVSADEIFWMTKPALGIVEVECLLEWAGEAGFVIRQCCAGVGERRGAAMGEECIEDDTTEEEREGPAGWTVTEWWWMALSCWE